MLRLTVGAAAAAALLLTSTLSSRRGGGQDHRRRTVHSVRGAGPAAAAPARVAAQQPGSIGSRGCRPAGTSSRLLWALLLALAAAAVAAPVRYLPALLGGVLLALASYCVAALYAASQLERSLSRQDLDCPANADGTQQAAAAAAALQQLCGTWAKDKAASDSMEAAMDLMRFNAVLRTAVRLIKGVQLKVSGGEFEMAVLSGILWFRITERYPLDGGERQCKRRDLRRGKHTGRVRLSPEGLVMEVEWGEPVGGTGSDVFVCREGGQALHVTTTLTVGGQSVVYTQVYRRQR